MTVAYSLLAVAFAAGLFAPIATHLDPEFVTAELEFADLPPARTSLLPEDWPEPVHPLSLPGIGRTEELAAMAGAAQRVRMFDAPPAPIAVEIGDTGRHHIGVAPGTADQQAAWNTPTGQFWRIVDELGDLEQPCSHCADPEDGEPAHVGCPGCACPCTLAAAVT